MPVGRVITGRAGQPEGREALVAGGARLPAAGGVAPPDSANGRRRRSTGFVAVAAGVVGGLCLLALLWFGALVTRDDGDAGAEAARDRNTPEVDDSSAPVEEVELRSEDAVADAASDYTGSAFFVSQVDTDTWVPTVVDEERSYGWRTLFERSDGAFIAVDVGRAEDPGTAEEAATAIAESVGDRLRVGPVARDDRPDIWYIEFVGLSGDNRIDVFHVVDGRSYATVGATTGDIESLRADLYHLVDSFETL